MSYKIYTTEKTPNYSLIKLATKAGLTNVVIKWYGAMTWDRHLTGWHIKSDQLSGRGTEVAKIRKLIIDYKAAQQAEGKEVENG